MFPTVLQPGVSIISNTVFLILVKCKCTKPIQRYDIGASTGITISVPGAENQDTERRRQIALRALSERLSKTDPLNKQWPSLNELEEEEVETASKVNDEGPHKMKETDKDIPEVSVQM